MRAEEEEAERFEERGNPSALGVWKLSPTLEKFITVQQKQCKIVATLMLLLSGDVLTEIVTPTKY